MLGLGLAALPQKLLAEVIGVVIEIALVAGVSYHYTAKHFELKEQAAAAAQVQANLALSEKNRALEGQLNQAKQDALNARASAQAQVASVAAAFRADSDGVRNALSVALRGSSGDSLAACEQRSARAGDLLADGLRVQIQLAGAAESLAADARAVRDFAAQQKALTGAK
jgi:hypothetical protein